MNRLLPPPARRGLALALLLSAATFPAVAQSSAKPVEPALDLPEITPLPSASAASGPLRKRLLTPRTGQAVPTGIVADGSKSGYSGGASNGINTGSDATRSSNGAAGTIAPPTGSKPLLPRDPDTRTPKPAKP